IALRSPRRGGACSSREVLVASRSQQGRNSPSLTSFTSRGAQMPTKEEFAHVAQEALQRVDQMVNNRFGQPYPSAVVIFPNGAELVTWAANADRSERPKFVAALRALLASWDAESPH